MESLTSRAGLSPQACVLEGLSAKESVARSASLVQGRFWRVLVFGGLVDLLGAMLGRLLGGVLIATTSLPIWLVNLVAAVVHAFALPFVGVAHDALRRPSPRRSVRATVPAAEPQPAS